MWMGPLKWFMLLVTLIITGLILLKIFDLYISKDKDVKKLKRFLGSILFWGRMAPILGILSQLTGIYQALGEIIKGGDISPELIMTGFRGSLISILYGLWLLLISGTIWFILDYRYKKLTSEL